MTEKNSESQDEVLPNSHGCCFADDDAMVDQVKSLTEVYESGNDRCLYIKYRNEMRHWAVEDTFMLPNCKWLSFEAISV